MVRTALLARARLGLAGHVPAGLRIREDLSDAAVKVYEDGDAVWLVEERGIQRMSRHAASVSEVVAIAAEFP